MKIAHIVNPFDAKPPSDLVTAQAITFKTMLWAKKFAKETCPDLDVEQYVTGYEWDEPAFPPGFRKAKYLDREIRDLYELPDIGKHLPLFRDILDRLYEACPDADYMIQTNADIGLMPHFYTSIKRFIEQGYDSFIINKRIISRHYKKIEEIPEMYCDLGTNHNGYDCFVFRREVYPKFQNGDICMGIPWSEAALAASMVAYSRDCIVFKQPHLTFHIGDERSWMQKHEYRKHNTEQFAKCLMKIGREVPEALKHPLMNYQVQKLKLELQPHYSKNCHDLCDSTALLF